MNKSDEILSTRLDIRLSGSLQISRERARNMIESGCVLLNGKLCTKQSTKLDASSTLEVIKNVEPKRTTLEPSNIPLNIVYEDEYLLVINKQAGISTHPPSINGKDTVANAVLHFLQNKAPLEANRPGIVHRLDKETTGLLLIAKTDEATYKLSQMIANRDLIRKYVAICYGTPKLPQFEINANIIRDTKNRLKMKIARTMGKQAITNVFIREKFRDFTLLDIKLETGRTHQIRLHLEHYGNSVVGDPIYGTKPPSFFNRYYKYPELMETLIKTNRQMLHAFSLEFVHPFTSKVIKLEEAMPDDFQHLLHLIKKLDLEKM